MIDAFVFWIMKGVAELAAVIVLFAVFVALAIISDIKKQIRNKKCKHERTDTYVSLYPHYVKRTCKNCGKSWKDEKND